MKTLGLITVCFYTICLFGVWASVSCPSQCKCPTDTEVDCSRIGNLSEVPADIPASTKILKLNNNNFTQLKDGALSNLTALESLYLGFNKLTTIKSTAFSADSKLKFLYLQSNLLTAIPALCNTLSFLQNLFLDHNKIKDQPFPPEFAKCSSILSVVLTGNQYSKLTATLFQPLAKLNLKSIKVNNLGVNQIEKGAFAPLAHSITQVDFSQNKLKSFDEFVGAFSSNTEFQYLNGLTLKSTQFENISKSSMQMLNFPRIDNLHLDHSAFLAFLEPGSLDHFQTLTHLFLSNTAISSIDGLIDKLNKLTVLDMSHTQLSGWKSSTFQALTNLEQFLVNSNRLKTLGGHHGDENAAPFLNSTLFGKLTLSDNPINCTCDIKWFHDALKDSKIKTKVTDLKNVFCGTPVEKKGTLVSSFDPGDCPVTPAIITTATPNGTISTTTSPDTGNKKNVLIIVGSAFGGVVCIVIFVIIIILIVKRRGCQRQEDSHGLINDNSDTSGCCLPLSSRGRLLVSTDEDTSSTYTAA